MKFNLNLKRWKALFSKKAKTIWTRVILSDFQQNTSTILEIKHFKDFLKLMGNIKFRYSWLIIIKTYEFIYQYVNFSKYSQGLAKVKM